VKRSDVERKVAESNLAMAEKLTMMMLARRADNDTGIVPDWYTPTQAQLAAEVTVSVRWLRELLGHLERHGWVKVASGRGRGHKSAYSLIPGADPGICQCSNKRGTGHPLLRAEKRYRETPFTAGKGELGRTEKGNWAPANPQVTNGFAPRDHQGGSREGLNFARNMTAAGSDPWR
jgi:hypothetical protein